MADDGVARSPTSARSRLAKAGLASSAAAASAEGRKAGSAKRPARWA